jgi:hypothetical protein
MTEMSGLTVVAGFVDFVVILPAPAVGVRTVDIAAGARSGDFRSSFADAVNGLRPPAP